MCYIPPGRDGCLGPGSGLKSVLPTHAIEMQHTFSLKLLASGPEIPTTWRLPSQKLKFPVFDSRMAPCQKDQPLTMKPKDPMSGSVSDVNAGDCGFTFGLQSLATRKAAKAAKAVVSVALTGD